MLSTLTSFWPQSVFFSILLSFWIFLVFALCTLALIYRQMQHSEKAVLAASSNHLAAMEMEAQVNSSTVQDATNSAAISVQSPEKAKTLSAEEAQRLEYEKKKFFGEISADEEEEAQDAESSESDDSGDDEFDDDESIDPNDSSYFLNASDPDLSYPLPSPSTASFGNIGKKQGFTFPAFPSTLTGSPSPRI